MRDCLILVRDGNFWREVGRVLDAKEQREAEERTVEEANDDNDGDKKDEGGGQAGAPLE